MDTLARLLRCNHAERVVTDDHFAQLAADRCDCRGAHTGPVGGNDTRPNSMGQPVTTCPTNAGILRTGDVLAEGFAGLGVTVLESDGTEIIVRTYSLQTGAVQLRHYPMAATVHLVHPDHRGRILPGY